MTLKTRTAILGWITETARAVRIDFSDADPANDDRFFMVFKGEILQRLADQHGQTVTDSLDLVSDMVDEFWFSTAPADELRACARWSRGLATKSNDPTVNALYDHALFLEQLAARRSPGRN
jgi:hypothetical protein